MPYTGYVMPYQSAEMRFSSHAIISQSIEIKNGGYTTLYLSAEIKSGNYARLSQSIEITHMGLVMLYQLMKIRYTGNGTPYHPALSQPARARQNEFLSGTAPWGHFVEVG